LRAAKLVFTVDYATLKMFLAPATDCKFCGERHTVGEMCPCVNRYLASEEGMAGLAKSMDAWKSMEG